MIRGEGLDYKIRKTMDHCNAINYIGQPEITSVFDSEQGTSSKIQKFHQRCNH